MRIFRGKEHVGTLEDRGRSSSFRYADDYRVSELPGGGIATSLPLREEPYETPGRFLPTFFENLLPEGFRADSVRARYRLALDDAFGMFQIVGGDTIGDVWAEVATGSDPLEFEEADYERALEADLARSSSVAGVQPKLSPARVTLWSAGRREILKLEPAAYPGLVENEMLTMEIARRDCRIETARTQVRTDARGRRALAVARFDRDPEGRALHQEDGCQLLDVYSGAKYRVKFRDLLERARAVSPLEDVVALRWLELYAFSYLVGNADLHAKNLSLYAPRVGAGLRPTPAYDLVSTMLYPGLDAHMALRLDGKDDNLKARDFIAFFGRFGVAEPLVRARLATIAQGVARRMNDLEAVAPTKKDGARATELLRRRADRL